MELAYNYPSKLRVKTTSIVKALIKVLAKYFSDLGTSFVKAQQMRADLWILNNMSNKDLKDIGITRGEIKERFHSK
mgnify:CR=1 FL=1|tara:strand:- start:209 stop:436 length:228 start_codon:yes stop_codon:yes gene_type:complete